MVLNHGVVVSTSSNQLGFSNDSQELSSHSFEMSPLSLISKAHEV